MILYITAKGTYVATQADAKRDGKGWHQVEVPTTDGREALAAFLNDLTTPPEDVLGNGSDYGLEHLVEEPQSVTEHSSGFVAPASSTYSMAPKPKPRMFPSEPTVDLMVDMIDRGDVDARGLSNLAESIAHRFEKISQELANA